jgi:hypothetical protein
MAIDGFTIAAADVPSRLHALFDEARSVDEFEFGCALLRFRGMQDAGWDPFVETQLLVEDLMALISAPIRAHTQVRLGLLLYSHLTEVGAVYDMLANLVRVIAGARYSIDPFLEFYPRNRKGELQFLSTTKKVSVLKEMLDQAGHASVAELLDWFFNAPVRNAFAHADYTLHEDKFRSGSERFEIGGIETSELELQTLGEVLNRALAFYEAFMTEYGSQRGGYSANKLITGRISGGAKRESIELLADPEHGLYGFRTPADGQEAP